MKDFSASFQLSNLRESPPCTERLFQKPLDSSFPSAQNPPYKEGAVVTLSSPAINHFHNTGLAYNGLNQRPTDQTEGISIPQQPRAKHSDYLKMSQFYKTKICPWYGVGKCRMGSKCNWSHDEEDLRPSVDLAKTKLCTEFLKGQNCSYKHCRYAHSYAELRATSDVYKTILCVYWSRGRCVAGLNCRYAHGEEELRHRAPASVELPAPVSIVPSIAAKNQKNQNTEKHKVLNTANRNNTTTTTCSFLSTNSPSSGKSRGSPSYDEAVVSTNKQISDVVAQHISVDKHNNTTTYSAILDRHFPTLNQTSHVSSRAPLGTQSPPTVSTPQYPAVSSKNKSIYVSPSLLHQPNSFLPNDSSTPASLSSLSDQTEDTSPDKERITVSSTAELRCILTGSGDNRWLNDGVKVVGPKQTRGVESGQAKQAAQNGKQNYQTCRGWACKHLGNDEGGIFMGGSKGCLFDVKSAFVAEKQLERVDVNNSVKDVPPRGFPAEVVEDDYEGLWCLLESFISSVVDEGPN